MPLWRGRGCPSDSWPTASRRPVRFAGERGRSMRLFEKHRPRSFESVVGQEKAIARLASVRSAGGLGGQAYFIQGPSGCGKTTIARLIAAEIAGPLATDEVNAADVDLEYVRDMERKFATKALARAGEPCGRAWIFNEA